MNHFGLQTPISAVFLSCSIAPGLPAVFVSIWASVRASLADTQYVDPSPPAVLWGGEGRLQMLARNLWASELQKRLQKGQEESANTKGLFIKLPVVETRNTFVLLVE